MRTIFLQTSLWLLLASTTAFADIKSDLQDIFARDMTTVDLARVKIEVDQLIDPSINVEAQLIELDRMVAEITDMVPINASSWDKVDAIRRYVYEAGEWNNGRAFSYDHDDPLGLDVQNRLLADYMDDRLGNCITMPFLFIFLGQRMGLDMTASIAPLHVFVKFTDDDGRTWNLEATSGAGPARDSHYRSLMPITDEAVANHVFLAPLTREETVAVIATVLVEDLIRQERYLEAMSLADVVLDHYPHFAYAMVKKGTAAYHLIQTQFRDKYATAQEIPENQRPYLAYLQRINQNTFNQAESLGWRAWEQ